MIAPHFRFTAEAAIVRQSVSDNSRIYRTLRIIAAIVRECQLLLRTVPLPATSSLACSLLAIPLNPLFTQPLGRPDS
jgi:hypothetical protein